MSVENQRKAQKRSPKLKLPPKMAVAVRQKLDEILRAQKWVLGGLIEINDQVTKEIAQSKRRGKSAAHRS